MAFGKKKNAKDAKKPKEAKKDQGAKEEKGGGKKLGKKKLIIIIVILLLLIAVVAVFAGSKLKGKKGKKGEATTETTTEVNPESTTGGAESTTEAGEDSEKKTDSDAMDQLFDDYGVPYFERFTASSVLKSSGYDYSPYNVGDLDGTTAWVEGIDNTGIGEWIDLSAKEKQHVKGVRILNGYCKSADIYMKNGRVRTLSIYSDEGLIKTVDLEDAYSTYQDIPFDQPISTNYLRFAIEDVYDGTKYDDTCISEIEVY